MRRVKAKATYLSLANNRKSVLQGNFATALRHPFRYFKTLFRAVVLNPKWSFLQSFLQAGYVADLLSQEAITHLHAHFATAPASVAMFTHHLTGIPYTFTAHAKDIYFDTKPRLLRTKIKHARAVVTISEYNRGHLSRLVGPSGSQKVHCVYNGMDLSSYTSGLSRIEKSPVLSILTVARLIEKKGIGDLIRACDILRERGRSFRVEIIGKGPLRMCLKTQVHLLNLQDIVRFRGALAQEAVRQAYGQADIFALPCVISEDGDRDGIPTVQLEAMACGLPVVSTGVSGIPELTRNCLPKMGNTPTSTNFKCLPARKRFRRPQINGGCCDEVSVFSHIPYACSCFRNSSKREQSGNCSGSCRGPRRDRPCNCGNLPHEQSRRRTARHAIG